MTPDERQLLLYVARWLANHLDERAAELGTTDNLAAEIRRLIERIRPQSPR